MDRLTIHGINVDMSASELERSITHQMTVDSISSIRNALFTEAMESGLVSVGDVLVKRRKTNSGKTVKQKHVSDIWLSVRAIKSIASICQRSLEMENYQRVSSVQAKFDIKRPWNRQTLLSLINIEV